MMGRLVFIVTALFIAIAYYVGLSNDVNKIASAFSMNTVKMLEAITDKEVYPIVVDADKEETRFLDYPSGTPHNVQEEESPYYWPSQPKEEKDVIYG